MTDVDVAGKGDLEPLVRNTKYAVDLIALSIVVLATSKVFYSRYNSIPTAETGYLVCVNSTITYKRRWQTVRVMYLTMFCGSVGFSIVFASLWPFLKKVDPDVNPTFLGFANAVFSLSQLVSSLACGIWCRHRPSREPLYFTLFLGVAGSILYVYPQEVPGFGKYMIVIARILLGLSAGNGAVARTVVAQSTTLLERNGAMANMALAQAIGFIVGPGFSLVCVPLGDKDTQFSPLRLNINLYTSAGIVSFFLTVLNIGIMICFFREEKLGIYAGLANEDIEYSGEEEVKPDMVAVIILNIIFFIAMTIFALNETLMTPLVMNEYAWSSETAVKYGGFLLLTLGVVAVVVFVGIKPLLARFRERALLTVGLLLMLAGFIAYLPWGNEYPKIAIVDVKSHHNGLNTTSSTPIPIGCPSSYSWCFETPKIRLWQYLIGVYLVGIGYPAAFVIVSALYSKVIGPRPQGTYNGWLGAVGCLARVLGPLAVTYSYVHIGPRWTFFSADVILTISVVISLVLANRLVPYHEYIKNRKVRLPAVA